MKEVGKTINEKGEEITIWECKDCNMRTRFKDLHKCPEYKCATCGQDTEPIMLKKVNLDGEEKAFICEKCFEKNNG